MTAQHYLYLALVFVAVVSAVLGLAALASRGADVRTRLRTLGPAPVPIGGTAAGAWHRALMRIVHPAAKLSTPETEEEVSRLRARFMHAGLRDPSAPLLFFAAKTVLIVALALLYLFAERSLGLRPGASVSLALMLAAAAFGYYLPNVLLAAATRRRQREVSDAFPDAIDLMIVCVEAGLGLDMAINRSAHEMRLRSPELAEELERVALELRVGASRERALRNLAIRTGLDEVSTFATMLLQADRFGTSLADSLRVHADALRTRRRLRAEEAAAKIPLKLLFPLLFFIFPSLMLVLLGPAVIQVYRILLPTLGGTN
ncbi:MAG: hypothetical protein RJA99_4834 [Pseudomonadota bacterium]|jgi:tight adherence protein C